MPDLTLAAEERWIDALRKLHQRLPSGALSVQVRIPGASAKQLLRWGGLLRDQLSGIPLIINDRLDVAAALEAQAVHLGRGSVGVGEARALLGRDLWVSRACHDERELEQASREGANAALFSPIFASPGKGPPLGLDALRDACIAHPTLRIFALGGVAPSNASSCVQIGASGVAIIRSALDPERWEPRFFSGPARR